MRKTEFAHPTRLSTKLVHSVGVRNDLAANQDVRRRRLNLCTPRGYVRRLRDGGDRRRVLVELTPRARKLASELYGSFEAASAGLRRYRPDQLELLRDFLEGGRALYEQQAARLGAAEKGSAGAK